jgi:hypothetical protein
MSMLFVSSLFGTVSGVSYLPSPWERMWSSSIHNLSWLDIECEILAQPYHLERAMWSVREAQLLKHADNVNEKGHSDFQMGEIFSRFVWPDGAVRFIEPLVGILRDPLTICDNLKLDSGVFEPTENWVQAKRFLLPEFFPTKAPSRYILLDAGASLYAGWKGDQTAVGAKWFVDTYARHDITFDHIISFEATQFDAQDIFDSIPPSLFGRYSYYNVPVSPVVGSAYNIWNVLLHVAKPSDYVVVKLDIDHAPTERVLVEQLLMNKSVLGIVDEFYYEHHVNSRAMNPLWRMEHDTQRMSHSYSIFEKLRAAGVRAHSWP